MQFNVPQFTEAEDKIIGPLTIRQFLILLAAGGMTFLVYSSSGKSNLATGIGAFIFFVPAVALTFGQFNGRRLYRILPVILRYFTAPKIYVFRREAVLSQEGFPGVPSGALVKKPTNDSASVEAGSEVVSKMKRIQYQLNQRREQEESIVGKIYPDKLKTPK